MLRQAAPRGPEGPVSWPSVRLKKLRMKRMRITSRWSFCNTGQSPAATVPKREAAIPEGFCPPCKSREVNICPELQANSSKLQGGRASAPPTALAAVHANRSPIPVFPWHSPCASPRSTRLSEGGRDEQGRIEGQSRKGQGLREGRSRRAY